MINAHGFKVDVLSKCILLAIDACHGDEVSVINCPTLGEGLSMLVPCTSL